MTETMPGQCLLSKDTCLMLEMRRDVGSVVPYTLFTMPVLLSDWPIRGLPTGDDGLRTLFMRPFMPRGLHWRDTAHHIRFCSGRRCTPTHGRLLMTSSPTYLPACTPYGYVPPTTLFVLLLYSVPTLAD